MSKKTNVSSLRANKKKIWITVGVIALVAIIAVSFFTSPAFLRTKTAGTVGGTKVSAAELNHYYIDAVNNFLGNYGDYVSMFGLDTTKALDEQYYNETEKQTWSDYFLDSATTSAQNMYAVYNAAKAEGKTLSAEGKASIDAAVDNMAMYATLYGFGSADAYIAAVYGSGCNEDTFRHYAEVQTIAGEFANDYNESLTYDEGAIRAEDEANAKTYSSYSYNYYYLANSSFYEGGTEDEEGNKTYSDEEKEAGRAAAEAAANSLLTATTIEELDAAIAALPINAESTTAKSSRHEDYAYSSVLSVLSDWVTGERTSGEIAVIPNESTAHNHADGEECTGENDTKTVNGYYVVRFDSLNKNETELVDVRHILVSYEGGVTDEATGSTIYSDEEKATARKAAQAILDTFNAGEKTEEAFAALATEKTTDTGSKENGGLYENVYPGQMVEAFNDWCFDSVRMVGDTAIVETEYGCHVMYFVGNTGVTYRDYMIESTLRNNDLTKWESDLIAGTELVVKNTKHIKTDLVLGSNS